MIYYLFNRKLNNEETKKSVLFILFDEKVVYAAVFSEGAVFSNFKGKKNYLNNININDEKGLLNFLENANKIFKGIELVLSSIDYKDDSGMINEGRLVLDGTNIKWCNIRRNNYFSML